ncbi:hypothetical protein LguiB_033956 [Lonicera macranthoides]
MLDEMLAARIEKGWRESSFDDFGKEEVGVLIIWVNEMMIESEAPSSSPIAPNLGNRGLPSIKSITMSKCTFALL